MWKYSNDYTSSVITANEHIKSSHKFFCSVLPKTAVLFYMNSGVEYVNKHYKTKLISKRFPSFLNSRPIYRFKNYEICFLKGGWGAPMAADTVETLAALGVSNIVSVGMFGAFGENVNSGDIVIPNIAFVEEGTSLHYYENINYSYPNSNLHSFAINSFENAKVCPIVTTDAVYKQTYFKENLWRKKGAVGVDMETSALFSVGKLLGINVVSILIASDKHPLDETNSSWKWTMTDKERYSFFDKCISFAINIEN